VELLESPELWPTTNLSGPGVTPDDETLEARAVRVEPTGARWLAVAEKTPEQLTVLGDRAADVVRSEFELRALQAGDGDDSVSPALQDKVRARSLRSSPAPPTQGSSSPLSTCWSGFTPWPGSTRRRRPSSTATGPDGGAVLLSVDLGDLSADKPETALEWYRLAFQRSPRGSSRCEVGVRATF